jgi:hypothetical protein
MALHQFEIQQELADGVLPSDLLWRERHEQGAWATLSRGDDTIGSYLSCGEFGVEAYDCYDVLIDVFANDNEADNAIRWDWELRSDVAAVEITAAPDDTIEQAAASQASDIVTRTVAVTFFQDKRAQSLHTASLTLPQLAERIRSQSGSIKEALPLLKLAIFGSARSRKNCLRTDANTNEITGIEIDYDKGEIAFDTAIATMRTAKLRALGYTSPSYVPVTKEKWRVLLPTSGNLPPSRRDSLVARVNGLFGGKLPSENFVLSQSFFYGCVNCNPTHRVEVVDGDFIDLRPDLDANAIGKPKPVRARKRPPRGGGQQGEDSSATPKADIMALLALSQQEGKWHNAMLSATASMVGRGWTDERIYKTCAPYCWDGEDDPDVEVMVEGARAKWNIPDGPAPERLARLPLLEYEQQREAAAKTLGLSCSQLDALVDAERAKRRKTIEFIYQERMENTEKTRDEIFDRVKRTIRHVREMASRTALKYPAIETPSAFAHLDPNDALGADIAGDPCHEPPVILVVEPAGSGKSTEARATAVYLVTEHPGKSVVFSTPRHKLNDEQLKMLRKEHRDAKFNAAIWRGRHADNPDDPDPDHPGKLRPMCRRSKLARIVEKSLLDVETTLCKRGRGENEVKCPLYDICAYQRQKLIKANIWFCAHECLTHPMPRAMGNVLLVIIDEDPTKALTWGIDDPITLKLDTLHTPWEIDPATFGGKYPETAFNQLMRAREALYHALDGLRAPPSHTGIAMPWEAIKPFICTTLGGSVPWKSLGPIVSMVLPGTNIGIKTEIPDHFRMYALTWRGKAKLDIRPNMTDAEVEFKLKAKDPKTKIEILTWNPNVKIEALMWELIEDVNNDRIYGYDIRDIPKERLKTIFEDAADDGVIKNEIPTLYNLVNIPIHRGVSYGRIQVHSSPEGRFIRMAGLHRIAKGWGNKLTLICDATGNARLLRARWPQLTELEPHGWAQMPRPSNVRIFQCYDRSFSKRSIGFEARYSKEPRLMTESEKEDLDERSESVRRLYAAVIMKALEYGGAQVGVIVYKSTEDWIRKNCFVPSFLKIIHWGDVTGTNTLQHVRALFVIGRPLPQDEDVTRQTEAMFGVYLPERNYVVREGYIPIALTQDGKNTVPVDMWQHPAAMAELKRRQTTEGGILQAAERARAGWRGPDEPLDINLWTDVPVHEIGLVEPVRWDEIAAGPDGLMLATKGCWCKNKTDAGRAFEGLLTADGLETARRKRGTEPAWDKMPVTITKYQRAGAGCKPAVAVFLRGFRDPRGFLEEKLGPLEWFFEIKEDAA